MSALRAVVAPLVLLGVLSSQPCSAGEARKVDIGMFDSMRFSPGELLVAQGETIRFVVRNVGKLQHEIVIGSHDEITLRRQAMHHEHGMATGMLHVAPGAHAQLTWQAGFPGQLEFACLLPGHYEAGMHGAITVLPNP